MHRSKSLSIVLILFLIGLLSLASIIAAGKETPGSEPSVTANMDPGPRPTGTIAFIKDGGIWTVNTDGGNRTKICEVTNARGRLSFSPDNKRIAFARDGHDTNKLPSDEGGRHLLFDVFIAFVDSAVTNPTWWNRVTFGLGGSYPQWSDNDTVIYYQNDINAGFVDYIVPSFQLAKVSINDGHADYIRKDWQSIATSFIMPTWTRDGSKMAYVISYSANEEKYSFQNFGVKIVDTNQPMLAEKEMRKPSKGLRKAICPQFSPDGKWLAYLNNDMRNPGIYIMRTDLSENRLVYAPEVGRQISPGPIGWSPNSKWMTFATADGTINIIDISGENLTAVTGPGKHSNPTWSN